MKKVALSLLALSVLAVGAFADDAAPALKFSGYFNTGIQYDRDSSGNNSFKEYAQDASKDYARFRLNGAYAGDGFGFKFRFQAQKTTVWDAGAISFDYAYAYVKPVDGLTIDAGYIGDSTLYMVDWNGDVTMKYAYDGSGNMYGKGVAAYYNIASVTVGAAGYVTAASDWLTGAFGAKFSNDDVTAVAVVTTHADKISTFNASASVSAVKGLTLNGGYGIYALDTESTSDAADFVDLQAEYAVTEAFTAGAWGYYYITDAYYDAKPYVWYSLTDSVKVGAEAELISGDDATQIPGLTASYVKGGFTANGFAGWDVDQSAIKAYADFILSF